MEFTSLSWSEYLTCLFIIHNNSQNVIYVKMYIIYVYVWYNMSLCVFLSRFNSQIWGWVEQRFGIPGQPCLVSSLRRDVSVGEASPHCDTAMILLKKGVCGWRVELCGSYWVLVHYKVSRLSLSQIRMRVARTPRWWWWMSWWVYTLISSLSQRQASVSWSRPTSPPALASAWLDACSSLRYWLDACSLCARLDRTTAPLFLNQEYKLSG